MRKATGFALRLVVVMALASAPALAQTPPASPPATPVVPPPSPPVAAPATPVAPVAPPAASLPAGTPPAAVAPAPASPAPAAAAPAASPDVKAAEKPVDPSTGTIQEVAARPVLRLKGKSIWDDGFDNLRKALDTLEAEAKRLNLSREGNAMAYFVDSDDNGFTFEAMVPLKDAAPAGTAFGKDIDAAQSPAGRAVIFHHEGAYDDIDTAYEAFTVWLDDKNLVSTGKFLEEYVVWPGKADETAMKIRISVFLK